MPIQLTLRREKNTHLSIDEIDNNFVSLRDAIEKNVSSDWVHTGVTFNYGTLINTDIDYSRSEGDPWVLEIRGNSYLNLIPFDIQIQGTITNNTISNIGGTSNGTAIPDINAINVQGKLCFWFARNTQWKGFALKVYKAVAPYAINRIVSVADSMEPAGTKKVNVSTNTVETLNKNNFQSFFQENYSLSSEPEIVETLESVVVAQKDKHYLLSGQTAAVLFPQNPVPRDSFKVTVANGKSNNILNPGNKNLLGGSDQIVLGTPNFSAAFIYLNDTYGWTIDGLIDIGGGGSGTGTVTGETDASKVVYVSSSSKTATKDEHYVITFNGACDLTLPSAPAVGDVFLVTTANGRTDTVLRGNGKKIMGVMEDLQLDSYTSTGIRFLGDNLGWYLFGVAGGSSPTVTKESVISDLVFVTSTSVTATKDNHYVLKNSAASTVTLPANPSQGDIVKVLVGNGRVDNVVTRNGKLLMGLSEDFTINNQYASITLRFIDESLGWRLV